MTINHWSIKSTMWPERRLLKHKELSVQLAFSMVLGLLHPSDWSGVPATTPEYQSLARRVRSDYRSADFTSASQSFWLSWEGLHTRSLQLAGLIAYVLRVGGFNDVPRADLVPFLRTPLHRPAIWTPPPPRLKVPLLENFSEDGVRPSSSSWQEWYAGRIRDLVRTIEDDEWYGYYVYTLDEADGSTTSPAGQRDPAMENVFFKLGGEQPRARPRLPQRSVSHYTSTATAAASSAGQPVRMPLEARGGKDGITGEFDFVGTVNTTTGVVSMRKNYRGAHYWDYEGVMTPLGIVGEWGREGTGYDGYFWLWKRSWMVGDAVPRTVAYYS